MDALDPSAMALTVIKVDKVDFLLPGRIMLMEIRDSLLSIVGEESHLNHRGPWPRAAKARDVSRSPISRALRV